MPDPYPLRTDRLTLRPFAIADADAFAALHADPRSMVDYGLTLTRAESDAKLQRYIDAFTAHGIGRLHVADAAGFVGYSGVNRHGADHPLGPHYEIGWRQLPRAWGQGYATEAAEAALRDAFARTDLDEILTYTAPDNARSRGVMERLGLPRAPERDFELMDPDIGHWTGQVWIAHRADWT